MANKFRSGFTLTELLVVMTIIGLLSSIATVSYSSSKMKGRDARRLGDLTALRTALELYAIDNGGYPVTGGNAGDGLVLGDGKGSMLSSAGFSDVVTGVQYIDHVPKNPPGGGADYYYYSLNENGTFCEAAPCAEYRIEYVLESQMNDLAPGAYVMEPASTKPAPAELSVEILARASLTPVQELAGAAAPFVEQASVVASEAQKLVVDNPTVEKAAEAVVAPTLSAVNTVSVITGISSLSSVSSAATSAISVGGAASAVSAAAQTAVTTTASAATAASVGQFGALLYLIFSQPFLLLKKKKEYAWGIVYDSQKKLPIDLAIVRLVDELTGRVVQTRVTDRAGRIFFFVGKGVYRLQVVKPNYVFPSAVMAGEREDGRFTGLYFGQKFSVSSAGQVVNPSIPLDPVGADIGDKEFIRRFFRGKIRLFVSVLGIVLTVVAFVIKPGYLIGGLLALNIILYFVFRRIMYPKQPAEWGVVVDEKTRRPVAHAVVRLFSSPYNKLVETKVADSRGRYNFLVGGNVYFLTATSKGYWKTESYPLDLRGSDKPQIISAPVGLRPLSEKAMNGFSGEETKK
jgi:prepilin-type N-terminal cleavage/methylation domain-containing protein